jgi:hypothetical protein
MILGKKMRRSQQYAGTNCDADIVGVPGLHVEVKRQEKMSLYDAVEQSVRDAAEGNVPVVMHRKNHKPWVIIVRCDDLVEFAKTVMDTVNDVPDEPVVQNVPKRATRVRPSK